MSTCPQADPIASRIHFLVLKTQPRRGSRLPLSPVYVTQVKFMWLEPSFLGKSGWSRIPLSCGPQKIQKADLSHQLMLTFPAPVPVSVPCPFSNGWASSGLVPLGPCVVPLLPSLTSHLTSALLSFGGAPCRIVNGRGAGTLDHPGPLVSHWLLPGKVTMQAVPRSSACQLCVATV